MAVKITKFRRFEKNTLQGFFTVLMSNIGLEIRDATYHEKDGQRWIGLPVRAYEDEDGNTRYSHIVKFVDKEMWGQFQKWTLKALNEYLAKETNQTIDDDIPF